MKKLLWLVLAIFTLGTGAAFAGICTLTVTRTACAGHEAESYKKCGAAGKACGTQATCTCDQEKKAADAAACAKIAMDEVPNPRVKVTKRKAVLAKFDGAPIEGGKDFAAGPHSDYDKCD